MKVKRFMLDFESAAWKAIKEVWPQVKIQGCLYHWARNIWKRIGKVGYQVNDNMGNKVITKSP